MFKFNKYLLAISILLFSSVNTSLAEEINLENTVTSEEAGETENNFTESIRDTNYLRAVIDINDNIPINKSAVFDGSKSYVPSQVSELIYQWEFGDGSSQEGIEVTHSYLEPGEYTITLSISNEEVANQSVMDIFAYKKSITFITDQTDSKEIISNLEQTAKNSGVYMNIIDSYGSSSEFISEEILTNKINEQWEEIERSDQIVVWTKENAGLNALSRATRNTEINLSERAVTVINNNIESSESRMQRQFSSLNPSYILLAPEAVTLDLVDSENDIDLRNILIEKRLPHKIINEETGKLKPWNFVSTFVNRLIESGIPDNTIALLLLLPIIATVVAIMRQVVGITTFGIYTPSIITLSFLVIGLYAGLLTLIIALTIAIITRLLLKKMRMMFIPKMAIVMTTVSITLLFLLIISNSLKLFDVSFISLAIFPMLILSTLSEKFVTVKSGKSLFSAVFTMTETVFVAIIAYLIAGGEVNIGFLKIQTSFIKDLMIIYPEIIFLIIIFNIFLGKWTGLRVLERIRFREILRHAEE